ncbi:MAG: isochorismatase family protein [Rhizobiaceae bacterium]|nr:isochorismatase family protein [Rhizobiaceae bacterium]
MKLGNAHSPDDNNHILLSSQHTMFVIVDHQIAFSPCFDAELVDGVEIGVTELADAAGKTNIPIITSLVKTNLIDFKLSATLEPKVPQLTRLNRNVVNPWDDPAFVEAVQSANRPCMLIAGLSAETSMSFTALGGLARGWDVFVVKDACLGHSEESIATTFERLTQAGAVPVSWRQVMMEWNQGHVEAHLLRRILRPKRSSSHVSK